MGKPRVVYRPVQDVTPEAEVSALANVFRFVLFEDDARKKAIRPAPEPDGRDDHGSLKRAEEADVT